VGVGALLGALVALLDNDDLLAGLTAREDNGNLAGLVDWGQFPLQKRLEAPAEREWRTGKTGAGGWTSAARPKVEKLAQ
jgi:hypothetical protein